MRKWWIPVILAAASLALCLSRQEKVPANAQAAIPAETKYIALTFDDGPRAGTTDRLLDGLRQRGASATFFLVGEQAAAQPELVRRMQAEGHQVGNHTWSHVRLAGQKQAALQAEIGETDQLLTALLGQGEYWLRPPYGQLDAAQAQWISVPMVTWSIDPRDWESRDRDLVVQAVLEAVEPGSIILLHDIYASSVDAALDIVDTLQAEGYWFVTVEELLRLNGVTPMPGTLYRTGTG